METDPTPHLEASLRQDIERIRSRVREMARSVRQALVECSQALFERKGALAYAVILRDQKIDDLEQEISYHSFFQGRLECIDESVREIADETHRIRQHERATGRKFETSAGGIERGEQLVRHVDVRPRQLVQQSGFS